MVLTPLERASAGPDPRYRHQRGVEDGDGTRHHRHEERFQHRTLEPEFDAEIGDQEAQVERSPVSHVDPGRMEIGPEESRCAPRKSDGQKRHQELAVGSSDGEHGHSANRRLAGSETVHVVQQVEGVGDANHPQNGQEQVERLLTGDGDPGVHPPQLHRAEDLGHETNCRGHATKIIGQTHNGEADGEE